MTEAAVRAVLNFDGGGNKGYECSYGFVVREVASQRILAQGSEPIGHGTNNIAEYRGLIAGLEACLRCQVTDVLILGDSQLIINQISGRYRVKAKHLKPLYAEAAALLGRFSSWEARWVPRGENADADALATQGRLV